MRLSDLRLNQYAIILSVSNPYPKVRTRLLEMGLIPGTVICKTKKAPWGDPIGIALRGYELCISLQEASYILVEKIEQKA